MFPQEDGKEKDNDVKRKCGSLTQYFNIHPHP